ncbi:peptidyl-tRNA hydrolase 2, mitochondrial [Phalaenopsis equestris]|uniref:peptidyl-tRNA hydrolase 2, mitochondrial n=1 Tax=Phalaenopsis equestris TaxID=78828 RepID=UPI0009E3C96D|nr:peptidyl-tRNA hydrolase 2, mitochondrial [Phalaenopsis equestris]XP_020570873.1 peptidyl-tRNA hydrolase 2, mitochondrial [Phalaenopsis equestris]XP_020570874.1 peptidyl-tRNA hydrolase 2, mitochondrial [Phalaenopsis equestris]XP_020570876.1 peptidyl-tRNA hydrolase 2, mitochondrial [Phalaenopsis equestris]
MFSPRNQTKNPRRVEEPLLAAGLKPENYLPGFIIGFLLGLFVDFAGSRLRNSKRNSSAATAKLKHGSFDGGGTGGSDELKMVLVVRQDLKMGAGKIASQCAHAATGMYAELLQSNRSLLRQWEQCGQPKIVVTCKNQQEMNRLKGTADQYGLPTFIVADAGRTQVQAGSKTVLAIGPGKKAMVDSVTGKQRLL